MILALLQAEALFDQALFNALVKFIGHAIDTGNYLPLILTLLAVVGAIVFKVVSKKTGVEVKPPKVIVPDYVPPPEEVKAEEKAKEVPPEVKKIPEGV